VRVKKSKNHLNINIMKTKQFKQSFFTFLMLLVMIVSFNGCCDEDDETPVTKTFLELYSGTTWILSDDGGVPDDAEVPRYARLLNDKSKIFDGWYQTSNEPDCYYYYNVSTLEGTLQIIDNSDDKLIFKMSYGTTESETFTFTIEGDTLKVISKYEEVGSAAEEYTIYFKKTAVNVDELTLCPS